VIPSGTLILLGFQTASSAFFVSVLEIRASRPIEGTEKQTEEAADRPRSIAAAAALPPRRFRLSTRRIQQNRPGSCGRTT
jgi:hypothetical protein